MPEQVPLWTNNIGHCEICDKQLQGACGPTQHHQITVFQHVDHSVYDGWQNGHFRTKIKDYSMFTAEFSNCNGWKIHVN